VHVNGDVWWIVNSKAHTNWKVGSRPSIMMLFMPIKSNETLVSSKGNMYYGSQVDKWRGGNHGRNLFLAMLPQMV
jgi:hypothetical protein